MTDKEVMEQARNALQGLFYESNFTPNVAVWGLGGSSASRDALQILNIQLNKVTDADAQLSETYTLNALQEKITEYLETLDTEEQEECYCSTYVLEKEGLDNFVKWLSKPLDCVGWISTKNTGRHLFFAEYPSKEEITNYGMQKLIYKDSNV